MCFDMHECVCIKKHSPTILCRLRTLSFHKTRRLKKEEDSFSSHLRRMRLSRRLWKKYSMMLVEARYDYMGPAPNRTRWLPSIVLFLLILYIPLCFSVKSRKLSPRRSTSRNSMETVVMDKADPVSQELILILSFKTERKDVNLRLKYVYAVT